MAGKKNPLGVSIAIGDNEMREFKSHFGRKQRKKFIKETDRVTQETTLFFLSEVRNHASKRPGPRVVTGAYRDSWGARMLKGRAGQQVGVVHTNHPAAHRLEYGFVGTDSLGRRYNQQPFPHFRPAYTKTEKFFFDRLDRVLAEWGID